MICRICNSECNSDSLFVNEKMFNTGEAFEYLECPNCNCLQIQEIPENMDKYYPEEYYSFQFLTRTTLKVKIKLKIFRFLSYIKNDYFREPSFTKYGLKYSDRKKKVLDVGSGNGQLLYQLKDFGFIHLFGFDPFLRKEIKKPGFHLVRNSIAEIQGQYDIIMSHHSLEHMHDPHIFFSNIARLLNKKGKLILRIPILPNYLWDEYSVDWIQLDAPRHLFTFSLKSIEDLCERYSLRINSIIREAMPWSIASTEYCQKGVSHSDFLNNPIITKAHISRCNQAIKNKNGDSVLIIIKLL